MEKDAPRALPTDTGCEHGVSWDSSGTCRKNIPLSTSSAKSIEELLETMIIQNEQSQKALLSALAEKNATQDRLELQQSIMGFLLLIVLVLVVWKRVGH